MLRYTIFILSTCIIQVLAGQTPEALTAPDIVKKMTSRSYDIVDSERILINEEHTSYNKKGQRVNYILIDSLGEKSIKEFILNKHGQNTAIKAYLNSKENIIYEEKIKYNKNGSIKQRTAKSWSVKQGEVEDSNLRSSKIKYSYDNSDFLLYEEHYSNDVSVSLELDAIITYTYNQNDHIIRDEYKSINGITKIKEYQYDSIGLLQKTVTKMQGKNSFEEIEYFEEGKATQRVVISEDKSKTRIENTNYNNFDLIETTRINLAANANVFLKGKSFQFDEPKQIIAQYFYNDLNLISKISFTISDKMLYELIYEYLYFE